MKSMRKRNKEMLKVAVCFMLATTATFFAFPETMDIPPKYWILVIIVLLYVKMSSHLAKANICYGSVDQFCEIPDGEYRWQLTAVDGSLHVYILRDTKTLALYGVMDFPCHQLYLGQTFRIENGKLEIQ
jgi:hypothetical protein